MTLARLILGFAIATAFLISQTRVDYPTQLKNVPLGTMPDMIAGPGIILIYNPSTNTLEVSVNPASIGFMGGPNLWTGNNDFGMASHSTPWKVGLQANAPEGCTEGEAYWATDRAVGHKLMGCDAGAWAPLPLVGATGPMGPAAPVGIVSTAPAILEGDGTIIRSSHSAFDQSNNSVSVAVNPAVVGFLGSYHNVWTGNNDFGMASHTTPAKTGLQAQVPSGCVVGELYFATDRAPGFNLMACTAPGIWTPMR